VLSTLKYYRDEYVAYIENGGRPEELSAGEKAATPA
jgi:hypothetical protein